MLQQRKTFSVRIGLHYQTLWFEKVHQCQIENCCWQFYAYPNNFHVRFEELFASTKRWDNVVVQVANGDNVKKRENIYNMF
jgi:hypothetical protein